LVRYILILSTLFVHLAVAPPSHATYVAGQEAYRNKDYATALREFQRDESPRSWYMIGMMHENGEGFEKSPKEAADWYLKAAEAGLATAQYRLGRLYETGTGVTQDRQEAVKWYRKAAEQNLGLAKYALKKLEQ
jgi:uncharacterized protein